MISGGAGMKCRSCRQPAVIEVRRHNAGFCHPCFVRHCRDQVARTVERLRHDRAGRPGAGGGVRGQGLPGPVGPPARPRATTPTACTSASGSATTAISPGTYARGYAARRGARLVEIDLPVDFGYDIPTGAAAARRAPCSACGLSKRHLFNQAAVDGGYDVRGDRAQPRRRGGRAVRQRAAVGPAPTWAGSIPCCRAATASPARSSRWSGWASGRRPPTASCKGIDYIVEECPMAAGNRHLGYKEALNGVEATSPGSKAASTSGSSTGSRPWSSPTAEQEREGLHPCPGCGAPTVSEVCAFCKLVERAGGHRTRGRADRPSDGPWRPGAAVSRPFEAGNGSCCSTARAAAIWCTLVGGGEFHTHAGPVNHDDLIGQRGRPGRPLDPGRALHRRAAHPRRGRAEDAPGRPGDLSRRISARS